MFKLIPPRQSAALLHLLPLLTLASVAVAQHVPPQAYRRNLLERSVSPAAKYKRDDSQTSTSRQIVMEAHDDFCLFGPPDPFNYIWSTGGDVVSWCAKAGHGTRLIPDETLHGVTYVKTDNYVQVSGYGDFTKINLAPGDLGGQFDSVSNTPEGATVTVGGNEVSSWVTLISATTFCMRACTGDSNYCPTDYDKMGCWFLTGNQIGNGDVWQDCESDSGDPPGVIDGTTYTQGQSPTPTPSAPSLSACNSGPSVSNGQSPPPLYSWTGSGESTDTSASASAGASDSGSDSGGGSDGGSGGESTTWVPVQTCTPCSGATSTSDSGGPAPSTTTPSSESSGGTTVEQEVTQISALAAVATTSALSTFADDLLAKRDGETTTSNGQCCFTTWTVSTLGAATTTATSTEASNTASASAATSTTASHSSSGSLTALATATSGSLATGTSGVVSGATGTLSTSGTNSSTNGTKDTNGTSNSTGNGSSLGYRMEVIGVECVLAVLVGWGGVLLLGGGLGGWSLA